MNQGILLWWNLYAFDERSRLLLNKKYSGRPNLKPAPQSCRRYALRSILDLTFSSNGRPVRLGEISDRQDISLPYLEQLFRRMRKGSVVKSVRGPGGGYVLARSMDEISICDVLLSVGENINPALDLVGSGDIKSDTVEFLLTKTYFENLGTLMQEYLATTTIGDLVRKARGQNLPTDAKAKDIRPTQPDVGPKPTLSQVSS